MMITLTSDDFRKLSAQCQSEILFLLGFEGSSDSASNYSHEAYNVDLEYMPDDYSYSTVDTSAEESAGSKDVIDISVDQAKALIANISEKSLETLKLFVSSEPVNLDALIGDGRPYESLSDLKRSFVGAVNRRLRTVTKNRRAVLFRSVKSKDFPNQLMVSVRNETAKALSKVFLK